MPPLYHQSKYDDSAPVPSYWESSTDPGNPPGVPLESEESSVGGHGAGPEYGGEERRIHRSAGSHSGVVTSISITQAAVVGAARRLFVLSIPDLAIGIPFFIEIP